MHVPVGKCNVAVVALLDSDLPCRVQVTATEKGTCKSCKSPLAQYSQSTNTCWASRDTQHCPSGHNIRSWASLRRWLQQLQREQDPVQKGLPREQQAIEGSISKAVMEGRLVVGSDLPHLAPGLSHCQGLGAECC